MIGCKSLTEQEIKLMNQALESERDKCLFLLGLNTGFRISELLSIKLSDIIEYGAIKASVMVSRHNMKGKMSSRSIPLSSAIQERLNTYTQSLPANQIYLFESRLGKRLSRIQAWRIIKEAAAKQCIKGKVATHSWRKSYCRAIYNASNKDIIITQAAMGHKNLDSTRSYLQVNQDEVNNVIAKIQSKING